MFSVWTRNRPTSTGSYYQPVVQRPVEPAPVIETPVVNTISEPMMEVIEKIAEKSPNVIIATIAPPEVDLDQEEDDDWNKHGLTPVVIAETRHIDIDTHEVVSQSDIVVTDGEIHSIPHEVVAIHSYEEIVDDVNNTLRDLGTATTEDAYTYGINRLRNAKEYRPDDWIVGHIFGGTYDLWIAEYNEAERTFFGFASFNGIDDQDAEWGYVSIDELLSIKVPPVGSKLERNFYFTPCTLDSIKNKEYEQKEQAIQLGADVEEDTPRIPWQVEHENHIMLAGWPWFGKDDQWVWREVRDWDCSMCQLEEWDEQDIFFDTEEIRDKYFTELNDISEKIYCPIQNEIMTFGDKVDKSTLGFVISEYKINQLSYNQERWSIHGIRFIPDSWKNGYTREMADKFIRSFFSSDKWKSFAEIKDRYSQWGGGWPAHKASTFEDYSYDSKWATIEFRGLQYCEDVKYFYTWKQLHDVLNTEIVQASLPIPSPEQRVADDVVKHNLPFSSAEEPASSTPLDWFNKPGYKKYEVTPRSSDRKDRLLWNMVAEHGEDLTSLYQGFSGKGGLHDLSFSEHQNFHDYTKAKQEFELWQFYTPDNIAETMVKILQIPMSAKVMDPTAGVGRFFNFIPNELRLYGFDNDYEANHVRYTLFPGINENKSVHWNRDIFDGPYSWEGIQYVIGNPPFNLTRMYQFSHPLASQTDEEEGGKGILLSQNSFLFSTSKSLTPGGISFFIAPATYLSGTRDSKAIAYMKENFYHIADIHLDDKAFSEYNVVFPTKAILLVKKEPTLVFDMEPFIGTFDKIEEFLLSPQYQKFLELKKIADFAQAKIKIQSMKVEAKDRDEKQYLKMQVLKNLYERYRSEPQEIEDDMDQKSLKIANRTLDRIEEEKAILEVNLGSYHQWRDLLTKQSRRLFREAHRPEREHEMYVEIIIGRYDIIVRRSNSHVSAYLNQQENQFSFGGGLKWVEKKYSKNTLATNQDSYDEFIEAIKFLSNDNHFVVLGEKKIKLEFRLQKGLMKHIEKFRKLYRLNSMDTALIRTEFPVEFEENYDRLAELVFPTFDKEGNPKKITLLPHQLEDLSALLLKRNGLISWDTGLGKTLGAIVWSMFKGGTTLVVAPAVNTIDPWLQQLREYRPDASVFLCKTKKDIFKYKWEDYLIVSLESFTTRKKGEPSPFFEWELLKHHFRNLILDESDNAKSKTSKRFKSLRGIAKSFKNRMLMSGTPTRNNVAEIYNQLELLCQNSNAMMCWATQRVEYDRSSREYDYFPNPYYGKPFPPRWGHKAFEDTFSPKKTTCFGANESNQDIFNKDILDTLMRSIRFTRDFNEEKSRINQALGLEDSGDYYEYKQVTVPMSEMEIAIYNYILAVLADALEKAYLSGETVQVWTQSLGNGARHDRATAKSLVIMQQILQLMQGTSHPWTFTEYQKDGEVHKLYTLEDQTSTKLEKACEIIDDVFSKEWNHKIMIGSPWRPTVEGMLKKFDKKWYMVFHLDSSMSTRARAKLVTEFRMYDGNAIILWTIGVLKSGLNLPEVNTVIVESYPWNFAQLHQFAARAIRLNSTDKTTIYCLTSEGSFDINVFSLILKKEVTNKFVRSSVETSMSELSEEFGVESDDLFEQALQMVRERVGTEMRGTIKWWEKPVQESSSSESVVTITHADKENFVKLAEMIGWADEQQIDLMNSLMTKSKEELLESLHSTDNPKFIGIINDTIRARFPN